MDLEDNHRAALRCDFRRYYGCSFDEVEVDECLDLVDGLPDGSAYIGTVCPERRWSEARVLATDIRQSVIDAAEALNGVAAEERTHIPRPYDAILEELARARAKADAARASEASEYIRNMKWEAV